MSTPSTADTPAVTGDPQGAWRAWSERRVGLQQQVDQVGAELAELASDIADARLLVVAGDAAAPGRLDVLLERQARARADADELAARLPLVQAQERRAQSIAQQAQAEQQHRDRVTRAAELREAVAASDARLDAAAREGLTALNERHEIQEDVRRLNEEAATAARVWGVAASVMNGNAAEFDPARVPALGEPRPRWLKLGI